MVVLKNWQQDVLANHNRKRRIKTIMVLSLTGVLFLYLLFCMFIFRRVVTLLPDWAWIAALLFSLLIAFLISYFIELMIEKSTHNGMKQYIERFLGISCVCFFIFLGSIDFYIYFFPKETHTYYTHCEITTPGPSSGRSGGHCKAGIKIKDKFTNKNFFLCFSSEKQPEYKLQALVKVQSNALGSYLVDYSLTKK